MPQQRLDGAQVEPPFEQVRGIAVAQGMGADGFVDTVLPDHLLHGFLDPTAIHGPLGRAARGGKQLAGIAVGLPVIAQCQQGALGERHIAVFAALGITPVDEHQLAVDIADLEAKPLAQTQAEAVKGQETDLDAQLTGEADEDSHLAGREDIRQAPGPRRLEILSHSQERPRTWR